VAIPVRSGDPLRGFRFKVFIEGFKTPLGFMRVGGLGGTIGVREYRELTDPVTAYKLPTEVSFGDVVLERGVSLSYDLENWWDSALLSSANVTSMDRREVTIKVIGRGADSPQRGRGELDEPLYRVVVVHRAWPTGLQYGDLNAMDSGVLVQSLTLANEGISFSPLKAATAGG